MPPPKFFKKRFLLKDIEASSLSYRKEWREGHVPLAMTVVFIFYLVFGQALYILRKFS